MSSTDNTIERETMREILIEFRKINKTLGEIKLLMQKKA
jgi:hypothetical protein